MENKSFNSLINVSRIEEVENHKYLCELIDVLDKNIIKEINIAVRAGKLPTTP